MKKIVMSLKSREFISQDDLFTLLKEITILISTKKDFEKARKYIIYLLDIIDVFDLQYQKVIYEFVEALGFYPYLSKNNFRRKSEDLSSMIRKASFQSDQVEDRYLHIEQKQILDHLLVGENIVVSAPTSFGKSILIEEVIATRKYKNILIIQPSLALIDETRKKLQKYKDYQIILRTSQIPENEEKNIFLMTAERVFEYKYFKKIDFFVVDEFYKFSLSEDDERAITLNNAFLKIHYSYTPQFYFLGPNIEAISKGFQEKYQAIFYYTKFSLVECNENNQYGNSKPKEKFKKLVEFLESHKTEQTLVFCSSPSKARRYAKKYLDHLILNSETKEELPLIEWIDKEYSSDWYLSSELKYGVAFHDGSLPKHLSSAIIGYFNQKKIRVLFCTTTITEGVNTSAKNIVLFDNKKGGKELDFFDYQNIKGRAGRMMEHYVGEILNLTKPPKKKKIEIDLPFYEQNPEFIKDEILLHIPSESVNEENKERLKTYQEYDEELLEIIKNNGVSISAQKSIHDFLNTNLVSVYDLISWKNLPDYTSLEFILNLAIENGLQHLQKKNYLLSIKQLAFYLNKYMIKKDFRALISILKENSKKKNEIEKYNEALLGVFDIYRNWFRYKIPKIFQVVESIQNYVCLRNGFEPGSYGYFIQNLENDFLQENISFLSEYGVPISALRKLEKYIPSNYGEAEVMRYIKENSKIYRTNFLEYEMNKINDLL